MAKPTLPWRTASLSKSPGKAGSRGCVYFEGGSESKDRVVPGSSFGKGKGNLDDFLRYWNRLQGGGQEASFPGHL